MAEACPDPGDLARRLRAGDLSLWPPGSVAADRLGWLGLPEAMRPAAGELTDFADRARSAHPGVVLFGMGGSSLAPLVLASLSCAPLSVLDTTHPVTVASTLEKAVPGHLALVASKSGTTIEPASLLAIWREKVGDPTRTVAVTDPGTALDSLARDEGLRVFHSPVDVGGRYSALTPFGLLPAALCGLDPARLLDFDASDLGPGVALGVHLVAEQRAGRDKVTLLAPPTLAPFGLWIEQLLAESTGKGGTGLVPVAGEEPGSARSYGPDRTFVALGYAGQEAPGAKVLEQAGLPVFHQHLEAIEALGELFFRWEVATAVAGALLGVDPFDEPDVALAKAATTAVLDDWPSEPPPTTSSAALVPFVERLGRTGDYVALLAYLPEDEAVVEALTAVQSQLRDRCGLAVTRGFGPRYLHSTGQLHKGGPNRVLAVQLVSGASASGKGPSGDGYAREVPGRRFNLARLYAAQALGDFAALRERGRRVLRVDLGPDPVASLAEVGG